MSITKNVFRLNETYDLINSGNWIDYDPAFDPGDLFAWGVNNQATIGDNTGISRSSPVQIPGTQWVKISGGPITSIATKTDGTLWIWGSGDEGSLGQGFRYCASSSPIQIPGTQWCTVAGAGCNGFAIKKDGTLWAWGDNERGSIGDNTTSARSSPVQIPGTNWTDIQSAGMGVFCTFSGARKTDGTLWMWGHESSGALGNGSAYNAQRSSPTQVPGEQWSEIAVGGAGNQAMSMAKKIDGTLWSWGFNGFGALGICNSTSRCSPVQIPGTKWNTFVGNSYASIASKTDGTLWAWGRNNYGEVLDGTKTERNSPVQIPGTTWTEAFMSQQAGFAIKNDNTLWVWGRNSSGRLGDGTIIDRSSPVQIPGTQWACVRGERFTTLAKKKN